MDKKILFNEIKRFEEIKDLYNGIYKNIFKLKKMGINVEELDSEWLRSKNRAINEHFEFMKTISRNDILSLGIDIKHIPMAWLLDYAKVTGAFMEDEVIDLYKDYRKF